MERIDRHGEQRRARTEWMSARMQDLRYALRRLRRAPWLTAGVTLAFALGIGANGTMFGIVDRLLLSPPPHIADADAVSRIYVSELNPITKERTPNNTISYPDYEAMQTVRAFSGVAAYAGTQVTQGRGAEARQATALLASGNYFHVLGVRAEAGRFFTADDAKIGAGRVVVISHATAERDFGGAVNAVGKTIDIGYGPYTIVGVAPRGFTGADLSSTDLWLPLEATQAEKEGDTGETSWKTRHWYWMSIVARLAPGATRERAEAEATAAYRRSVAADDDKSMKDAQATVMAASLIAARGPDAPGTAKVSMWLAGVSLIVLLIACANVANLLLARALRDQREVGIRLALGVSRRRLLWQVMLESLVLAFVGGLAALAVTVWGGPLVSRLLLPDTPWGDAVSHGRQLAFVAGLALVAGIVSGAIPAIQATRSQVLETLRAGTHSATRRLSWTRAGLTIVQAMLSIVLLTGAGLFVRSLQRVKAVDLGLDPRDVLTVSAVYDRDTKTDAMAQFLDRALRRVATLPGVVAAGADVASPFRMSFATGLRVPGIDSMPRLPGGGPYVDAVSSGFFGAAGLRIVAGRGFRPEDDSPGAPPTAVVNETMARTLWPGASAVGRCLIVSPDQKGVKPDVCTEVIGVVRDARRFRISDEKPAMQYYLALHANTLPGSTAQSLLVRVRGDAPAAVTTVRRAVTELGGPVRYVDVSLLEDRIRPQMRSWTLGAAMFTTFGLLALVVAAIGLYSVLAYGVAERMHELGVRAALGASRRRLVALVLRRGVQLVLAGVIIGVAIALAAAPKIQPLLFDTSPRDPLVLVSVAAVLLLVALLASVVPAWRATRVDPQQALRAE
ncbi:MAG TPA: ADOP family duplicated permease [Gemmatimonadaceae bacterium]|nr:ADOP family duplicated permease [Gemmatimonadaceae bacterium]